jgi:hypothetical protein
MSLLQILTLLSWWSAGSSFRFSGEYRIYRERHGTDQTEKRRALARQATSLRRVQDVLYALDAQAQTRQ